MLQWTSTTDAPCKILTHTHQQRTRQLQYRTAFHCCCLHTLRSFPNDQQGSPPVLPRAPDQSVPPAKHSNELPWLSKRSRPGSKARGPTTQLLPEKRRCESRKIQDLASWQLIGTNPSSLHWVRRLQIVLCV